MIYCSLEMEKGNMQIFALVIREVNFCYTYSASASPLLCILEGGQGLKRIGGTALRGDTERCSQKKKRC